MTGDLTHDATTNEETPVAKSGFAEANLKSFIDRIERLSEERAALSADITEVFKEAAGTGLDVKIMRLVIAARKLDTATWQEREALFSLYAEAVGLR